MAILPLASGTLCPVRMSRTCISACRPISTLDHSHPISCLLSCRAKTLSEWHAWAVAGQQSRWRLVTLCPGSVVGPPIAPSYRSGEYPRYGAAIPSALCMACSVSTCLQCQHMQQLSLQNTWPQSCSADICLSFPRAVRAASAQMVKGLVDGSQWLGAAPLGEPKTAAAHQLPARLSTCLPP